MALAGLAAAVLCLLAGGAQGTQVGAGAVAAAGGQQARQRALEAAWDEDLQVTSKLSPVKRVVVLLSKMKEQLEAETKKEAEMYDKMVCWCETNDKEKAKAVADAEAHDLELGSEIESRGAHFGQLSAEIARSKEEITENTNALQQATTIREKEAGEFRDEEQDLVQAVDNLRNAIAVLSKHQGSLLQLEGTVQSSMHALLRDLALKYEELVATRAERRGPVPRPVGLVALQERGGSAAQALLHALEKSGAVAAEAVPLKFAARVVAQAARLARTSASGNTFLQAGDRQPLYESRSSARSSGIFGLLNQMLEEFQGELSTSQKAEIKARDDYKELAAAKEGEIAAGKKKLDEMEVEHAANDKALADAREDLTMTRERRSADVEFLQGLKLTCNDLDSQWEKRSQTRAAETTAVAEAIAVLTEDDNREMLAKSVTLLQVRARAVASQGVSAMRASAVALLRGAASAPELQADDLLAAWHGRHTAAAVFGAAAGPRAQLSTLAVAVQLDSFTKVIEMLDKMVAQLKEQQAEEVQFKDYCGRELDTTAKTMYGKAELEKDLETKIAQLAALIEKLAGEIAEAQKQSATAELEIRKAGQSREEENGAFQAVVADQRATQSILAKALQKLKDFYAKGLGKAVLAQRSAQEPPVKFNAYKDNVGSTSVIGLIEQIIGDSKALEAATTAGEFKAQADYEKIVKDSNALIADLQAQIVAKTEAIAAAKTDTALANADLQSTTEELASLAAYEADLHGQCDFVLKNFDLRQKARLQEIEAIQAAKGILSGTK